MNVNENTFDLIEVIKFSLISLIGSLVFGLILYYLTQFSVYQYSLYVSTGLTVLAFPVGILISVSLCSSYMGNKMNAIIMGFIVAILTAFLQSGFISIFMGQLSGSWFDAYIGNQVFLLLFAAIAAAYLGNTYLKGKIN